MDDVDEQQIMIMIPDATKFLITALLTSFF